MTALERFIEGNLEVCKGRYVIGTTLWEEYRKWCVWDEGEPLRKEEFYRKLQEKGIKRRVEMKTTAFQDVKLKGEMPGADEDLWRERQKGQRRERVTDEPRRVE